MPGSSSSSPRKRRRLSPSRAVNVGAPVGGVLGAIAVAGLQAAGIPLTPVEAGAIGSLATGLVAWFTRGGRKGEGD